MERHREEVVNVYFAEALRDAGMAALGEQIEFKGTVRAMPDVLVRYRGLRCVMEGKYADAANARQDVQNNASDRVRDGIAHVSLGIIYPAEIREADQRTLKEELVKKTYEVCFCIETNYADPEWHRGSLEEVAGLLRRAYEILLADDILARSVAALKDGTSRLIRTLDNYPACAERIAALIGISTEPADSGAEDDEDE